MRNRPISAILKDASEFRLKKERIDFLRSHANNPTFMGVLKLIYDDRVKFALPEGAPPFTPSQWSNPVALYGELKRMYLFIEGRSPLNQRKRESAFIDLLEYVDPEEANLLIAMKDHRQPFPFLTKNLIEEAFPDLLK